MYWDQVILHFDSWNPYLLSEMDVNYVKLVENLLFSKMYKNFCVAGILESNYIIKSGLMELRQKPPTISVGLNFFKCAQILIFFNMHICKESVSRFSRQ